MSIFAFAFWEMVFLFSLGVLALPIPLSVPPLPEDPALIRCAPANSLVYVQWFGNAAANPDSANRTERLAGEPQVQALAEQMRKAARTALLQAAGGHELAQRGLRMLELALQRPGCLFVTEIDPRSDMPSGAFVSSLGPQAALAGPLMRQLEGILAEQLPADTLAEGEDPFEVDGAKFRALPVPGFPIVWGVTDGYVILATDRFTAEGAVRGLRAGTGLAGHPAYGELHGRIAVARPAFRSFLDLERIVEYLQADAPEALPPLEALGLADCRALLTETGLEGNGFAARTVLATASEPSGLLRRLGSRPLRADELGIIPGDANFAVAASLDPRGIFDVLRAAIAGLDERAVMEFDSAVAELDETLGVRLEEDLLAHAGDVVTLWNSPGQGGLLISGTTLAISLADGKAFGEAYGRAMARVRELARRKLPDPDSGRIRRGLYLDHVEHAGHTIWFVDTVGDDFPFAPAWCATDSHLLFSLFPQMIADSIDVGLDSASDVSAELSGEAVAISHLDAAGTWDAAYPLALMLGQVVFSELQREGIAIDISAWPTRRALARHLGTERGELSRLDDGLLLTRTGTLPVADPILGVAVPVGAAAAMWLRYQAMAALRAAEAARAQGQEGR